MRRIGFPLAVLLMTACFLTSCLGDNDDDSITLSSDAGITSFTLGTLNMYLHTTSSKGTDSIYKANLQGSSFGMYIDQERRLIYNVDSLPLETDVKHVLCAITSKGSGRIAWKSMTSDSLTSHTAADSIDFTKPRELRAYAADGSQYRTYTVTLNVHTERADGFNWKEKASSSVLSNLEGMKAVACNGNVFVLGKVSGNTVVYTTTEQDGSNWRLATPNFNTPIPEEAYKSAVVKGDSLYLLVGSMVMRTADGDNWVQTGTTDAVQLVGASSTELYALAADGNLMLSKDNGASWETESLDDAVTLLPTEDITCAMLPVTTNAGTERMILAGNRSLAAFADDANAIIWGKVVESEKAVSGQWMYYDNTSATERLPRMKGLAIWAYGTELLAVGGEGFGQSAEKAFSRFFVSKNGGVSWAEETRFKLPEAFDTSTETFAVATDSKYYIWLVCGKTGQVWKGRLNRMGWTKTQTSVTQ